MFDNILKEVEESAVMFFLIEYNHYFIKSSYRKNFDCYTSTYFYALVNNTIYKNHINVSKQMISKDSLDSKKDFTG